MWVSDVWRSIPNVNTDVSVNEKPVRRKATQESNAMYREQHYKLQHYPKHRTHPPHTDACSPVRETYYPTTVTTTEDYHNNRRIKTTDHNRRLPQQQKNQDQRINANSVSKVGINGSRKLRLLPIQGDKYHDNSNWSILKEKTTTTKEGSKFFFWKWSTIVLFCSILFDLQTWSDNQDQHARNKWTLRPEDCSLGNSRALKAWQSKI